MAVATIQTSFTTGEVSPSLFGHVDLARYHSGASTMRNMTVGYRGGAYSRAGTKFVGFSKQTGRGFPPRLVPFQFNINQGLVLEFGNQYMRVISNGSYVTDTLVSITNITQANPAVMTVSSAVYVTSDWLELSQINGMTELNGRTVILNALSPTTFQLLDQYGVPIDSTGFHAYTSGGATARIYTLSTIYGEADLEYLKFTQSADVMTLTCLNQVTLTEYVPQDLARVTDSNWSFSAVVNASSVSAPSSCTVTATSGSTNLTNYEYQVTAVSPIDSTESLPSPIGRLDSAVNIASEAGTVTVSWSQVAGVNEYNIYKASPGYNASVPIGALFGYAGSAYGAQFIDRNITADFTQVPPKHRDPFARGQIIGASVTAGGSGYVTSIVITINTSTGTGASLIPVVEGGILVSIIVDDPGRNYADTDTITITGDGTGATASLSVGPQTGTYPSVVGYYQQRRVYANTLNNPDTYWMSQPGAFKNFDYRIPTIASDSITGTPWAVQVNGIQWLVSMPGGLVALTGLSAWQLTGVGGSSLNPQPITPSTQQAQPQAYNGSSATVPPIKIDFEIIYLQAKGSIYRDLSYNFFTNIYTGEDLTMNSSQLFTGFTIREHAWCEEPYKVMWSIRNDGTMLSLTYNKPQQVAGWARHDTNGLFQSVCSVTEPPVDALYLAVRRFAGFNDAYLIERMDNRLWTDAEDCWCVDSGLALPQPTANATLRVSNPDGLGAITGVTGLVGGSNYSPSTTATVVDDDGMGNGAGAVPVLTISGGVITAVTFPSFQGSSYSNPKLVISDPTNTGSGASATLVLNNSAQFVATASVFSAGDVGSVIRMGGGIATITNYINAQNVLADVISPIIELIPNSQNIPLPQPSGNWTLTKPVTEISGLNHLSGLYVTGLMDGNVIPPTLVPASGTITLPSPASSVIVGLGFQAQLQSLYLDVGQPTVQGERKKIAAVTARVESSAGMVIGSNQPDGSTFNPIRVSPKWSQMTPAVITPKKANQPFNSSTKPLYTGDVRIPVSGGFQTPGQVAMQQDTPQPMNVLAFIPELLAGDLPETQINPRKKGQ